MTHHVDAMKFQSKIIEERNRADTMESYTSTISHEFRTPLATSIMFLEQLLSIMLKDKASTRLVNIVIT